MKRDNPLHPKGELRKRDDLRQILLRMPDMERDFVVRIINDMPSELPPRQTSYMMNKCINRMYRIIAEMKQ